MQFSINVSAQCTDLFISEYIEGSGNNKSIEIYNPTSAPVNLSTYALRLYSNGSATPSANFTLAGTLNPGEVHIVSNPSANALILAISNQTSGSAINFNGNDVVELMNGATAIDRIGIIGNDPVTGWTVDGITNGTLNHTLRRKPGIQSGNTTWAGNAENEWTVYAVDVFKYLDFHVMNTCGSTLSATATMATFCLNEGFYFNSNATGGNSVYTYYWEFGDATLNVVNAQNGGYNYSVAGTYNVTLVVTDGNGHVFSLVQSVLGHPAGPTACVTQTGGMNGCGTDTLQVSSCSTGGTGTLSYLWFFDNGNTSTATTPPIQYYGPGTYNAYMVVTDANGCDDTTAGIFSVNATENPSFSYSQTLYCSSQSDPTPTIAGTNGGTFSCNGCVINPITGEIDLSASGDGNFTIKYVTPGTCKDSSTVLVSITTTTANSTISPAGPFCELSVPGNLTAATPGGTWSGNGIIDANLGTFDPSAAGVGTTIITYTIGGACGSSDTETISVLANAEVQIVNSDTSICNDFFGFFLQANSGGVWSGTYVSDNNNGNGFFSAAAIPAGNYYAVYSIAGTCGDKDSILVTVNPMPTALFSSAVVGLTIQFTDQSTGAISWDWVITEGANVTNFSTQNPVYSYIDPSVSVNACVNIVSSNGCEATYCQTILPTSTDELQLEKINIYPNPAMGANISISGLHAASVITVYDLLGQKIQSIPFNNPNGSGQVNISEISGGTYFIEIRSGNQSLTRKIVILH